MRCPSCGFECSDDAVFCGACGSRLIQQTVWTNSGRSHPLDFKFCGREVELRELRTAFDEAAAGSGSLAVVVGEPGIGKTALCEQLASYAILQGGQALTGHCYEAGSLSLPYLAFVEVLRSCILSRDPENLRKELGTGAADISRIVPEISEKLKVEPRLGGDPEEERYRLLQAITDFLQNVSRAQPLLVILEDLHDADKGTLEMLIYVSRHLPGTRLLVVGTYRDVEVDRVHPLSGALAEFRRAGSFGRIPLRGLSIEEVHEMLCYVTGQDVPSRLAEAVHRQTEGNPLFVQEVLRYIVEAGLVTGEGGEWRATGQVPLSLAIPEGLRDVIGKRLSRLSPECNRILSMASVIGREFSLQVLRRVASVPEDDLYGALEEAIRAAILEQRSSLGVGANFRFAHAFFRQTLYEELFVPRRIRIHQQVGRVLEDVYAKRVEEHAAELAKHFAQSTESEDLAKAVSYSEMAAKQAVSVYAYGEAVRLWEQALQAQEALDPEDEAKRCDLLLALGEALLPAAGARRYLDIEGPQAYTLAQNLNDRWRASLVCSLAAQALLYHGSRPAFATAEAVEWAERADQNALPDTLGRAVADTILGVVRSQTGGVAEGTRLFERAIELGRRKGYDIAIWRAAGPYLGWGLQRQRHAERLRFVEELAARPKSGVSSSALWVALAGMGHVYLEAGQRIRSEETAQELRQLAEQRRLGQALMTSTFFEAIFLMMDGRLEDSLTAVWRAIAIGEEQGLSGTVEVQTGMFGHRQLLYLGRAEELLSLQTLAPVRALNLANLGRREEVVEILDKEVLDRAGAGDAGENTTYSNDVLLLEASTLVGHRQAVELLLSRFSSGTTPTTGMYQTTCVDRHLGAAKAFLGQPGEGLVHYEKALQAATEMRFRPEIALTRLQLAELLIRHYPSRHSEAMEHLDFAIEEFRSMKMRPALGQALQIADRLAGAGRSDEPKLDAELQVLTAREREVTRLIARGLTGKQVADELVISQRTVETHVANILRKLNLDNRIQLAAWAIKHRLSS